MERVYDIISFGAVSDGVTDCTAAIQAALDEAGKVGGVVVVPPGNYLCGYLKMPRGVMLTGYHTWSFRHNGSSILTLIRDDVPCLLDLTKAIGCTVKGISLEGRRIGKGIHGMLITHSDYNGAGEEDTPTIEDCRINGFSGNGLHLHHIWCFSVRHSMFSHNMGHGIYVDGWDGFIIDNWMSGNGGAGMYTDGVCASVTATGNRVEWNRLGGFVLAKGNTMNITGNYFDRSGGPALKICATGREVSDTLTITGNIFNRSGAGDYGNTPPSEEYDDCHVRIERCINMVFTGNTFRAGTNDGGGGRLSPAYAIVIR
ncbi:MAG: right-handed parallel beta-helix repeat-containing protein, partial [Clostridia bacterium]|nr:right-handed parallel beta-helix repeat-containing protein [Clostridia bacterium]